MYVVRLRKTDGRVARKAEFPDIRDALRHMDAFVCAFPDLASEVLGRGGVLFRYDPHLAQASGSARTS